MTLPLLPLRGLTILPSMVIHFDVGREKSIKAVETAMDGEQLIFLATQKDVNIISLDEPVKNFDNSLYICLDCI